MMKVKSEKGSIALFVFIALIFYTGFLLLMYSSNLNKMQTISERTDFIRSVYEKDIDNIDEVYNRKFAKTDKILTATVENKYKIEIRNANKEERCNYRIWGNSIPDTTNPIEVKSVGDKINLLDINNPKYTANSTHSLGYAGKIEDGVLYNAGKHGSADGACIYIEKPEGVQYLTLSFEAGDEAPEQATTGYVYKFYYFNELDETTGIPTDLYRGAAISYTKGYNSYTTIDCSSYKYVGFTTGALSKYEVSFRNIQLEVGKGATEYASYGKYIIPIKVSRKNLACYQTIIENGFVEQEDGSFYTKLSSIPYERILYENKDKVEGAFTISYYTKFVLNNNYVGCYPVVYYTDGTKKAFGDLKEIANKPTDYVKVTYTTDENKVVDNIVWGLYTGGAETFFKDMQIEYGNTATDFETYAQKYYIYLDEPLAEGDYIDFDLAKVKRADGTEENVDLPEVLTFEDYTQIEVLTEVYNYDRSKNMIK